MQLLPEHNGTAPCLSLTVFIIIIIVVASYSDLLERFSVHLRSDKILRINLAREMYQKLGVEGKKLDKRGSRFEIAIDLGGASGSWDGPLRARIHKNLQSFFGDKTCAILLGCSELAAPKLQALLQSRKLSVVEVDVFESQARLNHIAMPPIVFDPLELPASEDLEEWNLWLGAIINEANLLVPGKRVDPFIGVCRLPEGKPCEVMHHTLRAPILATEVIVEHLETLAGRADDWDLVALVGRNSRTLGGFALYLRPSLDFLLCSSTTSG